MAVTLTDLISEQSFMTAFGEPVKDGVKITPKLSTSGSAELNLVQVYGTKVGGSCVKLPKPTFLFLPGDGLELSDEGECGFKPPIRKWVLDPAFCTSTIEVRGGDLETLLGTTAPSSRDASGSISFSNWRWQNGSICATAHISAHVKECKTVLHHTVCVTLFDISKDVDVCVPLSQCINVSPIPGLELDVCYNPPNQLCGEVKVKIEAWSGTVAQQCFNIPIPKAVSHEGDCGCKS
jgi:hypothetical protein